MALFGRKKTEVTPVVEETIEVPLPQRTIADERAVILADLAPLRPFGMQINDVNGLTLCEDIVSDLDFPLATTAVVDGFGVRAVNTVGASEENPVPLTLLSVIDQADTLPTEGVASGGCAYIAQGAPIPAGVDALIPSGQGKRDGDSVSIFAEAQLGQNLSLRGALLSEGTKLLSAGTDLDARAIGLLAEVGLDKVLVRPKPRIVVLSYGEGLIAPGQPLTSLNQRYASGTAMVSTLARSAGATVYPLELVAQDDLALTLSDQMIRADAVIVVAGTEDGARHVSDVIDSVGEADPAIVAVGEGRFIAFGRLGDERIPVLVMSGSALDLYVDYQLFARPLVSRLADRDADPLAVQEIVVGEAIAGAPDVRFVPVSVTDGVKPVPAADSGLMLALVQAEGLLYVPAEGLAVGDSAECWLLGERGR